MTKTIVNTNTIIALAKATPSQSQFTDIYEKMLVLSFVGRHTTKYSAIKDGSVVLNLITAAAQTFSKVHGAAANSRIEMARGACLLLATEDIVSDVTIPECVAIGVSFGLAAYGSSDDTAAEFDRLVDNALVEMAEETAADAKNIDEMLSA